MEMKRKKTGKGIFRRKRVRSRKSVAPALRKKILKVARSDEQKKYYLTLNNANQVVLTGQVTCGPLFPLVALGSLRSQHNGARIRIVDVKLRLSLQAGTVPAFARVMIIKDKVSDGVFVPTTPAAISPALPVPPITNATDWFIDGAAATSYLSGYMPQTVGKGKRYTILKDKTLSLPIFGGAANLPTLKLFKWHYRPKNHVVTYNDVNGAGYDSIQDGLVYLCIYTNVAANGPIYNYEILVQFSDV